ncbi:hypothetical protein, partial [Kaistella sp.]|uniref:hypothetical protein n=1 Tax=Kaistella sp. TaxID=2782235 RepID=UPI002F93C810
EKKLRGHNSSFDLISKGRNLFVIDDLLSERLANNFGEKLETMGKILENMEYRTAPFIFTLNPYKDQSINDTLNYIQSRYGARAYDRLFSTLNFIELKGRSLRS